MCDEHEYKIQQQQYEMKERVTFKTIQNVCKRNKTIAPLLKWNIRKNNVGKI